MTSIDGFVLAGGMSRRMGTDKASLKLGGKTLVERAVESLSAIAENVFAVGCDGSEHPNVVTLPDDSSVGNPKTAFVGVNTAFRHARSEWAAILACDLPFVTQELMRRLAEIAEGSVEAECVVPIQPDGRLQPLCALYRLPVCGLTMEKLKIQENWRLRDLIDRLSARRIKFAEMSDLPGSENFFFNMNTPADYQIATRLLE